MLLTVNFIELCSISLNPDIVVTLQYLSYYYGKPVCSNLDQLAHKLNINRVSEINWSKFVFTRRNTLYSKYRVINPITPLVYRKILTLPIQSKIKFVYLYYTSLLHPFSTTKFLPKEAIIGNVESLLSYGLMEEVKDGFILIKERGE